MSLPVNYLPEARDDIDAAYSAYEQKQIGLGDRFLDAIRDRVQDIQSNPALYGVVHQDVRAAPLRRFPFVIYYRIEPTQALIIAVQHGRKSLAAWQSRI